MKRILLLKGGKSREREISYRSAKAVSDSLKRQGLNFIEAELDETLPTILQEFKPTVVFNATHGTYGEDGRVQGLLDILEIPYTHSSLPASALAMDKDKCKIILAKYGVNSAKGEVLSIKQAQAKKFSLPIIFKPNSEGSSFGIEIIKNNNELQNFLHSKNEEEVFLVEEFIEGRELTVGVFQNKALGVLEIKPKQDFYNFTAKYTSGGSEYIMPAKIPENIYKQAESWAEIAHAKIGCNTLSRSDFIYSESKGLFFLEINTQPGFTETSLIPKMAKYNNISFDELVSTLIKEARTS